MWSCCCLIGKTEATEDSEMIISGRRAKEALKRSGIAAGLARVAIDEMCCGVKGLDPKRRRHLGVKKKTANTVIQCAYDSFGFAVLGRGIGTG